MKERPILFNGEMVRAILAGSKTQTRRLPVQDLIETDPDGGFIFSHSPRCRGYCDYACAAEGETRQGHIGYSKYGQPGDRLWVRESVRVIEWCGFRQCRIRYESDRVESDWMDYPFRLKGNERSLKGRRYPNGCFREASRITLEITDVRVQRIQEITLAETHKEGALSTCNIMDFRLQGESQMRAFADLWDSLVDEKTNWISNPWVWAITFKRVQPSSNSKLGESV